MPGLHSLSPSPALRLLAKQTVTSPRTAATVESIIDRVLAYILQIQPTLPEVVTPSEARVVASMASSELKTWFELEDRAQGFIDFGVNYVSQRPVGVSVIALEKAAVIAMTIIAKRRYGAAAAGIIIWASYGVSWTFQGIAAARYANGPPRPFEIAPYPWGDTGYGYIGTSMAAILGALWALEDVYSLVFPAASLQFPGLPVGQPGPFARRTIPAWPPRRIAYRSGPLRDSNGRLLIKPVRPLQAQQAAFRARLSLYRQVAASPTGMPQLPAGVVFPPPKNVSLYYAQATRLVKAGLAGGQITKQEAYVANAILRNSQLGIQQPQQAFDILRRIERKIQQGSDILAESILRANSGQGGARVPPWMVNFNQALQEEARAQAAASLAAQNAAATAAAAEHAVPPNYSVMRAADDAMARAVARDLMLIERAAVATGPESGLVAALARVNPRGVQATLAQRGGNVIIRNIVTAAIREVTSVAAQRFLRGLEFTGRAFGPTLAAASIPLDVYSQHRTNIEFGRAGVAWDHWRRQGSRGMIFSPSTQQRAAQERSYLIAQGWTEEPPGSGRFNNRNIALAERGLATPPPILQGNLTPEQRLAALVVFPVLYARFAPIFVGAGNAFLNALGAAEGPVNVALGLDRILQERALDAEIWRTMRLIAGGQEREESGRWFRIQPPWVAPVTRIGERFELALAYVERRLRELRNVQITASQTQGFIFSATPTAPIGGAAPGKGREFWLHRSRDRRLLLQTLRDMLEIVQRDETEESGKKTLKISARQPILPGSVPGLNGAVETLIDALKYDAGLVRVRGVEGQYYSLSDENLYDYLHGLWPTLVTE